MEENEVTPRARHRKKIVKEDLAQKNGQQIVDQWLVVSGDKVLQKFKKSNGSVYTRFIGRKKQKETRDYLERNKDKVRY